ncbi:hypothetical protein [Nocardia farcinica]|uniref:hypothetical protein n=1 Tax=Nocardia farcinica TaxID=37329 RepID=UPI002457365C|nr:hypothetical protein [Nocardia farcinica]
MELPKHQPDTNIDDADQDRSDHPPILLTGEGLARMTPERLQMLREMLGGLGLTVTLLSGQEIDLPPPSPEEEAEPVLASREDFLAFAREHGYADMRAFRAWRCAAENEAGARYGKNDGLPPVRFVGLAPRPEYSTDPDRRTLDLRSVHERLIATQQEPHLWGYRSKRRGDVRFLAHMVNEVVQPDEPLPLEHDA